MMSLLIKNTHAGQNMLELEPRVKVHNHPRCHCLVAQENLPLFEEEILDSLYLTIGSSDSLGLGDWLESGHLTDPGQIAEY
jgi:hypothetical protein